MMAKRSLFILALALVGVVFSDLEVSTLEPWVELGRMFSGAISPDFSPLASVGQALFNTVAFALIGTCLGGLIGGILALFWSHLFIRLSCAFIRSIHELFWAFLLMPLVGLNPTCGVLAIAIPYAGIFAKVYAEILEEADPRPLKAIPQGSDSISRFFYGYLPSLFKELKHYTSYRFECALRSSAILGFIGLPTLGYHLETWFREAKYGQAFALLYVFYFLVLSLKTWARPKLLLLWVSLALFGISKEVSFSWENTKRFFTSDILPWPLRAGKGVEGLGQWFWDLASLQAWEGMVNTLVLTQISLALSAIFALILFPLASQTFAGRSKLGGRFFLVILRSTPEYFLAYIAIYLLGPSMLPAIIALVIHNGAILGHLSSLNADQITFDMAAPRKRINLYLYEVLPRIYGQFLAFLLYRWEVIFRESAILGILGVYSLGFFIDSAMALDHLDEAFALIVFSGLLNILIDQISRKMRVGLKK
ncbi:MAG: ABC transporter permease [SAR324 cluster bacterium]|nr:ABC transporter permease [SAR324 cluster bacterium]